jgi:hypothetical protein
MRPLAGFLLAPLPAAVLAFIWYSFNPGPLMPASMAVAVALYLYAVQLVFGIAIILCLNRWKRTGGAMFALGGAAMAGLPLLLFLALQAQWRSQDWETVLRGPYWFAIFGGMSGLTYWLVVRPGRRIGNDIQAAAQTFS